MWFGKLVFYCYGKCVKFIDEGCCYLDIVCVVFDSIVFVIE